MPRRRITYAMPGAQTLSPSDENEANSQRELAYNTAAAAAYQRMREAKFSDQSTEAAETAAQIALAKALGEPVNTPMGQLTARFYAASPQVQAGIYKAGGAQFLSGTSGAKMLDSFGDEQQKALNRGTDEIASHLATGKIQYDITPDGKPSFYSLIDDPEDPLKQKKIKQPLNNLQLGYLDRGFKNGTIPNPFNNGNTGTVMTDAQKQIAQSHMSSADFQKILDQRANPDSAYLAANLAQSKTPQVAIAHAAPVKAMPSDPALVVNQWLNQAGPSRIGNTIAERGTELGTNAVTAGVDTVSSILNLLPRAGNFVNRAVQGANAPQFPTIPYLLDQPIPKRPDPETLPEYDYSVPGTY